MTFRIKTRDLTDTFGGALGAQLVDIYDHDPASTSTSTAASDPTRHCTIASGFAWNRLIQVQGFGQRYVKPNGDTLGTVGLRGNAISRFSTVTVPKAMDVIAPATVQQSDELDDTLHSPSC